ncbi:MAG: response regulator [Desulfobulbaceae bacterium]|nr:response regulator [Desulfobulbaceae bacterium]
MQDRILIIDDDQANRLILQDILDRSGYSVLEAEDGETGIKRAVFEQPDLILLDINMPGINGLQVCRKLRSDPKNVFAIIMITASDEREVEGLESGADDYILKPFQEKVLLARIKRGLLTAERRKDAHVDSLTNVFNRRTFNTFLAQEEERASRYSRPLAMIMADIDNFKDVNDTYGHDVGDQVLIEVANLLRRSCRGSDLLARFGGEEFVILLPEADVEDAIIYAEKARVRIEKHTFPQVEKLTASFGIAELRKNDALGMVKRADQALYVAKNSGRNKVSVEKPVGQQERLISLLVIDDDEAIRDLIRVKMMYRGYEVQVAENGDAAFRILQKNDIDMVLIDQEMPGRDGMATYMVIKNEWPKLPAIMITAHGSKHLIKSFLVSGGRDFIEKPIVDFESFDFRIKRVLAELRKEQEAEEKIRASKVREESRKIKDVFLASMSHELRTPLAHIIGFTQRLQKADCTDPEKQRVFLDKIEGAAQSLNRIVEDILDVTLIESHMQCESEWVSLQSVVGKVADKVSDSLQSKAIILNISVPKELPKVHADERKLGDVFEKLIGNAIKFTEVGSITVNAQSMPNEVIVSVRDTGCGISQQKIARLFEPFGKLDHETGNKAGTGLGLYICRRLIELMGGRIWVSSEEGKGTTFFFSLKQDKEQ